MLDQYRARRTGRPAIDAMTSFMTDSLFRIPAIQLAEAAQPHSDTRGSADYKRTVVRVFTERGLRTVREGNR